MPKRKGPPITKSKAPPRRRARGGQLVWVDQRPLRHKAASECGRAMDRLEKARAEWRRFEREDQPAFRRWVASTFGVLSSRIREVEAQVREKEVLVRQVEEEMFFGGHRSYRSAYAYVQKRRTDPNFGHKTEAEAPPPREQQRSHYDDDIDEQLDDFAEELLFEEFVRTFLHINPDRMSDRKYEQMFADFKANFLGKEGPERFDERKFIPEADFPPEPPKPMADRVKELYRLLVRRLHPDMKADRDAEVSALWHEVQEAYNAGNVDRLEMLLAFTDIQSNTAGEHTSLFQMRSVLAELRRAFNALQRNLRAARKDHAWNFARLGDRSKIETRVRREMESTLAHHEGQLRELEMLLARWSAPQKTRRGGSVPTKIQAEFW